MVSTTPVCKDMRISKFEFKTVFRYFYKHFYNLTEKKLEINFSDSCFMEGLVKLTGSCFMEDLVIFRNN